MKAEVKFSRSWVLIIPKNGNAPMLFLEWISKFRAGKNWIHKIQENLDNKFCICLNMDEEKINECANYINSNL